MSYLGFAKLRNRYHRNITHRPAGLDKARLLAIFIGCCFKYRVNVEDIWATPKELANLLLYCLRKAGLTDEFEYAKRQIYDYHDRFHDLRFTDLWVIIEHIFPEIKYENLELMSTYRQITSK